MNEIILIHETDLFHPHGDPDDHFDLATLYALQADEKLLLKDIIIDYPPSNRIGDPDVCAVTQLNYLTAKSVSVQVGTSALMRNRNDTQEDLSKKDKNAVSHIAEILQKAVYPVYISIVGSCADIAVAGKKYPQLFKEKCAGILLNSGSAIPYKGEEEALEYNVKLNKSAYAAIFDLPCPIYWFPCYHTVLPNWNELGGEYGTVYHFNQKEVFSKLSDELKNFFLYMLERSDDPKYLRYLTLPVDNEKLSKYGELPRRMWSTPSFLFLIGKSVDKNGNLVDINSPNAIFALEPIKISCNDEGVTEWEKDNTVNDRFIFHITDTESYNFAMTKALGDILAHGNFGA